MNSARIDSTRFLKWCVVVIAFLFCISFRSDVQALTLNVKDSDGKPIKGGFRWLVEEDNTYPVTPGAKVLDSLAVNIFKSYAPVVAKGHSDTSTAIIDVSSNKRYMVSVLPNSGYSIGGANITKGQDVVKMIVNPHPFPTAQISILIFHDNNPINNTPDIPFEEGLEGFSILLFDQLGQVSQDAFANPLGTTYQQNPDGTFVLDADGNPVVDVMGSGVITTDEKGEAFIKYIVPGKYGIRAVPSSDKLSWSQTATIEGTPGIDTWVKANEPPFLVEFGPTFYHVFIGFVEPMNNIPLGGTGSITGQIVRFHSARPPALLPTNGVPVSECWIGLNDLSGVTVGNQGIYAQPCNPDSSFEITSVPPGTYQIVIWDTPLDYIFGFYTVIVPPGLSGTGDPAPMGKLPVNAWFGNLRGSVFNDIDQDGFRDCVTPDCNDIAAGDEIGISDQVVNIRFRDASIYQFTTTRPDGTYEFREVFPFFKWWIQEVDFTRFRASGVTIKVDQGALPGDPDGIEINPQPQAEINPNTGDNLSRTEVASFSGEVLLEAQMIFADQTNIVDWGKKEYGTGENGGIAGIVYYATTRTEADPRFAVADGWEPGIPRVQINLYQDSNGDEKIDDVNGNGVINLSDVDNFPFGNFPGPEDIDRNGNGKFNAGDAIQIVYTDSWDDNMPTECVYTLPEHRPLINGQPMIDCAENLRTWNQVRPGVFDGGYIFHSYFPGGMNSGNTEVEGLPAGTYIVEAVPPKGYELVKEEDQNIFTGDQYIPSPLLIPPVCLGDLHKVPQFQSLFPDQQLPAPFAGQMRPLCDRKQVTVEDGKNSPSDFYFFTKVPKAARVVGLVTNDLANTLNAGDINFTEKQAPSWLPVSFQDYLGNEITRVYTDEFGAYNALLPSTFTINPPIPTGVSPDMVTVCLNHPGPIKDPNNPGRFITDPWFNTHFSQTCLTFDFWPAKTTILDTPVIPVAAFTGATDTNLDCEFPDGTPVMYSVSGPGGGPFVRRAGATVTIVSVGKIEVPNPDWDPTVAGSPRKIKRDYGFGGVKGTIKVGDVAVPKGNVTWSSDGKTISFTVPAGMQTGELVVTRGDNGSSSVMGVTLTIGDVPTVVRVSAGQSIQNAINTAPTGALILVAPGVYQDENIIVWKNVRLQGWGAPSTIINGSPFPSQKVSDWRALLKTLTDSGQVDLLPGQDPTFKNEEAPGIMVLVKDGEFTSSSKARIDGFTVSGANEGGGMFINAFAHYLEISNNRIINNLGTFGGGIRIGNPSFVNALCGTGYCSSQNDNISIHNNQIIENGGINGGGGVNIYKGADNYGLSENLICGNFSSRNGAGVSHLGLSNNGLIANNMIILNESFYGDPLGGEAGGILIAGQPAPVGTPPGTLTEGSGSVTINTNVIQGNLAGSGDGGGIRTNLVNGQDVQASTDPPNDWYFVNIFNNIIVNNVSGLAGGGISIKDTARVKIINNTLANNDSTASGISAFGAGALNPSTPQGAGVVSRAHSIGLLNAIGAGAGPEFSDFSNPVLYNNIVWHNRSFYFDPAANAGLGGLVANPSMPYWDLQVQGTVTPVNMDPKNCILTDTTGYDPTNIQADPTFVSEYFNQLRTVQVAQEGGNFVNVIFRPLTLTGDYRILSSSPAVDKGSDIFLSQFPELQKDFEGEVRPTGSASDIGADETSTGFVAPGITVTQPDGVLKNWKIGSTHVITWTYTDDPGYRVKIELLKGDQFFATIAQRAPIGSSGSGSYSWTIPLTFRAGTDYKINVTSTSNSGYTDTSDNNFTLRK
jgi:hypothetical protein